MEHYKEYIGNKYFYDKENIEIVNIKKVSGNIVVLTKSRTFNFYETEIENFINDLQPYRESTILKAVKKDSQQDDIKQLLFDAINKVKTDKSYVQQANAICNLTSQLINIKKLELKKR